MMGEDLVAGRPFPDLELPDHPPPLRRPPAPTHRFLTSTACGRATRSPTSFATPSCPITVLLAEHDQTVLPTDVLDLPPSPDVRIVRTDGDHGIAYDQPGLIATLLLEQLDSHTPTQGAVT